MTLGTSRNRDYEILYRNNGYLRWNDANFDFSRSSNFRAFMIFETLNVPKYLTLPIPKIIENRTFIDLYDINGYPRRNDTNFDSSRSPNFRVFMIFETLNVPKYSSLWLSKHSKVEILRACTVTAVIFTEMTLILIFRDLQISESSWFFETLNVSTIRLYSFKIIKN